MNRKHFLRSACSLGVCSCAGLGLLANTGPDAVTGQGSPGIADTPVVPADARQIQNLLSYIESSTDGPTTEKIFERLGHEHTTKESFIKWINGYKTNIKSYFDMVNSSKDTYWEKMEYDAAKSSIIITGKPVDKCACAYAQSPNPPKSLCTSCCKNFQKSLFAMLLDKPVEVRIDEAFLLGDNRCSTTIFVEGGITL